MGQSNVISKDKDLIGIIHQGFKSGVRSVGIPLLPSTLMEPSAPTSIETFKFTRRIMTRGVLVPRKGVKKYCSTF
jgi:hypothetical protein